MERVQPRGQGESFILGAEPFSLGSGPIGVLLVHGFTSTPYDVRACAEFLESHGIAADGILLAGHGTHPEDLRATKLEDWLQSIREGFHHLARRCSSVFALGVSLSGNFLLTLAPSLPLAGLVLVGTPLRFRHERAYRLAFHVLRGLGREYQRKWYLERLDQGIRARRPTYDRFPLACVPDCLKAVAHSKESLPAVRCPVLILQSTKDHAVSEDTVAELKRRLGTRDVAVRWFKNRYHVLLIDHGAEEVFSTIADFVKSRSPVPPRHEVPRSRIAQRVGFAA